MQRPGAPPFNFVYYCSEHANILHTHANNLKKSVSQRLLEEHHNVHLIVEVRLGVCGSAWCAVMSCLVVLCVVMCCVLCDLCCAVLCVGSFWLALCCNELGCMGLCCVQYNPLHL